MDYSFYAKKKRHVSTFWPNTHCPPIMRHRFPYTFWWAPLSLLQEYILYWGTLTAFIFSPYKLFGKSDILSLPWQSALKRQRTNVAMYFINDSLSSNKTKKPLQWNNLMLHLFLVDTLIILLIFLPKYLEISLVICRKKLGLTKVTSVLTKKNKKGLLKIKLENVLAYQVFFKFIIMLLHHPNYTRW